MDFFHLYACSFHVSVSFAWNGPPDPHIQLVVEPIYRLVTSSSTIYIVQTTLIVANSLTPPQNAAPYGKSCKAIILFFCGGGGKLTWPSIFMGHLLEKNKGSLGNPKKVWVHPWSLTWNLKMAPWKRRSLWKAIIFRFYVKLWGCI